MELAELFGELRSLLEEPPTRDLWGRITRALDHFDDDTLLEQVVSPYLLSHFCQWPEDLIRPAWPSWYLAGRAPARKRALHALATAPCPFCKKGRGVDEVKRALKLQYGKRFTDTVRVRDLMTQDGHALWACDVCRRFPCPRCEEERTFDEMGAALVRIYADEERHPNDLAREVARRDTEREWACEACLDGGAVVSWRPPPSEVAQERSRSDQANEPYEDITSQCKECHAPFVFTAAEQRAWYDEYGIPKYYYGMYGARSAIRRARCDACQRRHVAQKRVGEILRGGFREDLPGPHRELERLYTTLGNDRQAGYHRNVARRLEGDG